MSAEFRVYFVACRGFAEKVIGAVVIPHPVLTKNLTADGTFFLDREDAEKVAEALNERDSDTTQCWWVYEGTVKIERKLS